MTAPTVEVLRALHVALKHIHNAVELQALAQQVGGVARDTACKLAAEARIRSRNTISHVTGDYDIRTSCYDILIAYEEALTHDPDHA